MSGRSKATATRKRFGATASALSGRVIANKLSALVRAAAVDLLDDWAVPKELYIAADFVSVATCILVPMPVRRLLSDRLQSQQAR